MKYRISQRLPLTSSIDRDYSVPSMVTWAVKSSSQAERQS
jgi:hypothetical protein